MIEIIWKIMLGTLITSCIGSCVKKLFMIFSNNKNKLDHIAQVRLSLFGINYFLQFTDPISFTFWLNYSWYQLKLFNAKEWQYSTETRSYDSTLCKLKIFQIYSLLFFTPLFECNESRDCDEKFMNLISFRRKYCKELKTSSLELTKIMQ